MCTARVRALSVQLQSLLRRGPPPQASHARVIRVIFLEVRGACEISALSGTNPVPHKCFGNAVAIGSVTVRWDRARDGCKYFFAHAAKTSRSQLHQEAAAHPVQQPALWFELLHLYAVVVGELRSPTASLLQFRFTTIALRVCQRCARTVRRAAGWVARRGNTRRFPAA